VRPRILEGIAVRAKVVSTLFVSADGVAEIDPSWHFPYFDQNMGRAVTEDYDTADVLLLGRVTYDGFAPLDLSWRRSEVIEGDLRGRRRTCSRGSLTPFTGR
jgi:hypothetical protein